MEKRWELYSCQVSCKVLRHTAASNNRTEAWSEHERAGHRKQRRANRRRRASIWRGRVHRSAHPGDHAAQKATRRRDFGALLRAARGAGRGRLRRRQLRLGETGRRPAAADHRAMRRGVHGRIGEAAQSGQDRAFARARRRLPHGAHDQQARYRPRARRVRRRPSRGVLRQLHRRGEDLVRRVRDLLERREDLQQPAAAQHPVHPRHEPGPLRGKPASR